MKKLLLLSAFFLPLLWGCDFLSTSPKEIDLDSIVNSGSAVLSGARNTAKGVGKDYYNDQIKPTVDTAIDTAKQEADKLAKEAKNQVNSGIDQVGQDFSDRMQENADTVRDQIDGLKIK